MDKFIEYEKLSKKEKKKRNKEKRVLILFNVGTRVHKDKKHPNRAEQKKELKKTLDNE